MRPDPKLLAHFARVEPPPELDAWVRAKLHARVTELRASVTETGPARATRATRTPASVPFIERLALGVGAVACAVQASGFVLRLVWSALDVGR